MAYLDTDAYASTRPKIPDNHSPLRRDRADHVIQDSISDPFGKDGLTAIGSEVLFERLAFETAAVGRVSDCDLRKIRLAGDGAVGGELLREKSYFVITRRRVFKGFKHRFLG